MPDLLLLDQDQSRSETVISALSKLDYRIKHTQTFEIAYDWLKTREFSGLISTYGLRIDQQQLLANLLWGRNPEAPFLMYIDTELQSSEVQEARLSGIDIIRGSRWLDDLKIMLGKIQSALPLTNPFRILVVEDLDSPRDIICSYIESLGYNFVEGASSAMEALERLGQEPERFACVITDLRMPKMDGKMLIEALRKNRDLKNLPIICLTAYGTVDTLLDCLKVGASGFLVKPPKKLDLNRELARARRIVLHKLNPRLCSVDEIEGLRRILEERGLI